jgi:hypothetical protein
MPNLTVSSVVKHKNVSVPANPSFAIDASLIWFG